MRMPVVFAGHGSPMIALDGGRWAEGFARIVRRVPEPRAILSVSAHWFVPGTFVTAGERPSTIHDFSGFPEALYEIDYPAPGSDALASRVCDLVGTDVASPTTDWGLDHGTWSVLKWMYPEARIPVVQLSLDHRLDLRGHLEIAQKLRPLRDEGVLILGSGNVTHNLRDAFTRLREGNLETPEWARRFDARAASILERRDTAALLSLWPDGEDGRLAHPSPDHLLPLVYVYGAADEGDRVETVTEGFDLGSLSMRSVTIGA